MAAGLGFKDFVTGEVLTAADVDGYLMQGVWVFASAAARDAAVTSPQEGNFAYLKDTNVTTYYTGSAWANLDTTGMTNPMTTTGDTIYSSSGSTPARLGIGSTGQVLTVASGLPSWATPAGGGGMTLLSTTTLSGSSTSISSIDQTYNTLQVWIYGVYRTASTDSVELFIAPNGNTSEVSNGVGTYQDESTAYTTAYGGYNQKLAVNCGAVMRLEQTSSGGNDNYGWLLTISNYTSSTQIKAVNCFGRFKRSGGSKGGVNWGGGIFLTDAITSLDFSLSSGSFGGGTVRIYGVK